MKSNFFTTACCACPLYKIRIDPNSYDKEEILKDIKFNKSLKNTRHKIIKDSEFDNADIHHSYGDVDNENFKKINYEKLIDVYSNIFDEFFSNIITTRKDFSWEFSIQNYTAITEGQWFPAHNHVGKDDFATIHYLNFNDEHVLTRFKNPAIFAPYLHFVRKGLREILDNTLENHYLWENFSWEVEEDDMIIFPAVLDHEIPTQGPTKEPRITIASNIKLEKYEESNN